MKTYLIIIITHVIFLTQPLYAELHEPDGMLSTSEAMLEQDVNARRTVRVEHADMTQGTSQPQDTLPVPEIIPFPQAMYPVVYYQPPAWQIQMWQQQQAMRQHARALQLAAYYPPMPEMFLMPEPEPTATPRPTATPQPTPTPIVQNVIEKRTVVEEQVIVKKVVTVHVTATPAPTATPDAAARIQHLEQLIAKAEEAKHAAILWLSIFIGFGIFITAIFVYWLKSDHKNAT
jgi:hypothetical protein